jgi:hypothetical protein
LTVTKAAPTIAQMTNITKTFGDANFTLTPPTSNSTGSWTYTSSNTAVATVSNNTVTIKAAGSTTITATQAANNNYLSGSKTATLTIAKAVPTISQMANISKTNGSASFSLTQPTSNSTGSWTYTSSNTAVATVKNNLVTIKAKGTSTITANQAASRNYLAGSTSATLTVT